MTNDLEGSSITEDFKEFEARYRAILRLSPEAILFLDVEGRLLEINDRLYGWFGYKPEEVVGLSILQMPFLSEESKAKAMEKFSQRMLGREVEPYDLEFISKVGEKLIGRVFATPVRGKGGKVVGDFVMISNITERRMAEDALREISSYLENLFSCANALILVWNPKLKINRLNHAFEHLTGYRGDEVIGQHLSILFPEESQDESLQKIVNVSGSEHGESVEIQILCKNGETRLVLWNSANIYAGDNKTLLSTIAQGVDITERKRVEMELKEKIEDLEKFNRIMVGRELRMINLKKEVNGLLERLGERPRYNTSTLDKKQSMVN